MSVAESAIVSHRKYHVPFEKLGEDPVETSVSSRFRLWAAIVLAALAVFVGIAGAVDGDVEPGASLFYGLFAALAGGSFLLSRRDYIVYRSRGGESLVFMKDRPSKEELANFVQLMQQQKRDYLRERYSIMPEAAEPVDRLAQLAWLHDRGVIDAAEFAILKSDLIRRLGLDPPGSSGRTH